jgi:hypothetical protein
VHPTLETNALKGPSLQPCLVSSPVPQTVILLYIFLMNIFFLVSLTRKNFRNGVPAQKYPRMCIYSTLLKSHRVLRAWFHLTYNSETTVQHSDLTQNYGASGKGTECVTTCRLTVLPLVDEFQRWRHYFSFNSLSLSLSLYIYIYILQAKYEVRYFTHIRQ